MIELFGILASICILISFTFKEQRKIRIINMIGCIVFVFYGILIKSFSIIFLNLCTFAIHIYHLKR